MIRKSIYLFLLIVAVYFGFAYLVAIGSLGSYEGPGEITTIPLPKEETTPPVIKMYFVM